MKTKAWAILAIALVGGIAEGIIVLVAQGVIPTCGCQNANGQPYPWCPQLPCPGREALNLDSSRLNSPTNMTLNVRNTGIVTVTFIAYCVKDASGNNQCSNSNWSGPTINPSALMSIDILIDGNAFTFQSGSTYLFMLVTSGNDQFVFQVQA